MKRILIIALALMLAAMPALAAGVVYTTASVNLREGPGLEYDKIAAMKPHTLLDYLGETSTDERGVDWYMVDYEGQACWISSRYSELEYEPGEVGGDEPVPEVDPADAADVIESRCWYGKPLTDVAEALGLDQHDHDDHSEVPEQYYNDAMRACGGDMAECFVISGTGYKLFGAYVGMSPEDAMQALSDAGLEFESDSGDIIGFEHAVDETTIVDIGLEHDYNVLLQLNEDQTRVVEISLNTYTG